jgi:hypothetical protein
MKKIADFQITEKELLQERRFGLIAMMCDRILKLQHSNKRNIIVNLNDQKTKKGMISFDVIELDRHIGVNKNTLELGVIHVDKNNNPDGEVILGKIVKWKKK